MKKREVAVKNVIENMPNQVEKNESMYGKGNYILLNLTCSTIGHFYKGGKLESSGGKFMIYFLLRGKLKFFQAPLFNMFIY